jgi:hypothetical protein
VLVVVTAATCTPLLLCGCGQQHEIRSRCCRRCSCHCRSCCHCYYMYPAAPCVGVVSSMLRAATQLRWGLLPQVLLQLRLLVPRCCSCCWCCWCCCCCCCCCCCYLYPAAVCVGVVSSMRLGAAAATAAAAAATCTPLLILLPLLLPIPSCCLRWRGQQHAAGCCCCYLHPATACVGVVSSIRG